MKTRIRILNFAILLVLGIVSTTTKSTAQNFITGPNSSYVVPNDAGDEKGVIKMKAKNAQILGKWGKSAAYRMPGTVSWYCEQSFRNRTYFTNMLLHEPGKKIFIDTVDVSRDFKGLLNANYSLNLNAEFLSSSVVILSGDDPDYTQYVYGIFGTHTASFSQPYKLPMEEASMFLTGSSPKEIPQGHKIDIMKIQQTGAPLTVKGMLYMWRNGKYSFDHLINNSIPNPFFHNWKPGDIFQPQEDFSSGISMFCMQGASWKPVDCKDLTQISGDLFLYTKIDLNISGRFQHLGGRVFVWLQRDCFINYVGTETQIIEKNGPGFPAYARVKLSGGNKIANGDIYVRQEFRGNCEVDMAPGDSCDYVLHMMDGFGPYIYGGKEIRGKIEFSNPNGGNIISNYDKFVLHNDQSHVSFLNKRGPTLFCVDNRQQTRPTQLNDFDPITDVSRKIKVTYSNNDPDIESIRILELKIRWEKTDEMDGFVHPNTLQELAGINFAEGYSASFPRKKVIMPQGKTYISDYTETIRAIHMNNWPNRIGVSLTSDPLPPNPITSASYKKIYSGSELVISKKPLKVESITDGRWSNPGTWDIGREPLPTEDVSILNKVWVGDNDALFGASAYTVAENSVRNGTAAANSITIENTAGAGLYIGNNDPNMVTDYSTNYVTFRTVMVGDSKTGIKNLNLNPNTSTNPKSDNGVGFNGIWISSITDSYVPILGASQFIINGSMVNNGMADVGECNP